MFPVKMKVGKTEEKYLEETKDKEIQVKNGCSTPWRLIHSNGRQKGVVPIPIKRRSTYGGENIRN